MTAYAETLLPPLFDTVTGSSSEEAERLQQREKESLEHYFRPIIEQLFVPIVELLESSRSEKIAVDLETAKIAVMFAQALPRTMPLPEVSSDPDGEVSFDWIAPSGSIFSVSVNRSRRLAYAGWFGENSRTHGTEKLGGQIPDEILRGIQKATR